MTFRSTPATIGDCGNVRVLGEGYDACLTDSHNYYPMWRHPTVDFQADQAPDAIYGFLDARRVTGRLLHVVKLVDVKPTYTPQISASPSLAKADCMYYPPAFRQVAMQLVV